MTYQEIATMLKNTNLPVAYMSYPIGQAPPLPYLVYYYDSNNDMIADNTNYQKVESLVIELYTETKDLTAEGIIEDALKSNKIVYTRSEAYIEDDLMYQERYESEVIING